MDWATATRAWIAAHPHRKAAVRFKDGRPMLRSALMAAELVNWLLSNPGPRPAPVGRLDAMLAVLTERTRRRDPRKRD